MGINVNSISWLVRHSLAVFVLCAQSLVIASPTYQFLPGSWGDEVAPADFNDLGVILWRGFPGLVSCGPNDQGSGGSFIESPPYSRYGSGGFVRGYDGITACGVYVSDINNAGDMLGTAFHNGVEVPTLWIGGIAFDLTDPANVGLTFEFDPGPKRTAFDLWSLEVLGLPSWFDAADRFPPVSSFALTNSRGDFIFDYDRSVGILIRLIPEPGTPFLVLGALGGLALMSRRRPRRIAEYSSP